LLQKVSLLILVLHLLLLRAILHLLQEELVPHQLRKSGATKNDVETAIRKGFLTAEEANEPGEDGKLMNAAYTRSYARAASSSPDKTARGRQFQGPAKGRNSSRLTCS
jgi:hypothetical protein